MTDRIRLNDDNRRWWTLGAMCFALFMVMLDNTVVNVALPSIQDDLGASLSGLEWTVNAYTLTFAVLLVTGGRLGDIFGRRRMFLFGVVVFALSSAAIGLAPTQGWLVGGPRDPGHRRRVHDARRPSRSSPTRSRPRSAARRSAPGPACPRWRWRSARWSAARSTEYVSWRAIFFLNLPVAAGAVAVTLFAARESRDETVDRTVDCAGIAALSAGLTALVLALVEGNAWGWGSPEIVGAAGHGGRRPRRLRRASSARVRAPMVDFQFFRSRTFLGANVVAFIVTFAMLATFFFTALYMQNFLGYGAARGRASASCPRRVVIIVIAPIAGRLADRVGPRRADDRRAAGGRRLALPADPHLRRQRLRRAAARLHAAWASAWAS